MLGLSPREARARFDRIIDFAELREFADLKLKNYSSGMLVRLAFAVMIQVDADILLIDEVLAVGDAAFQQKCFDEFARIRRSGATVLLVTHDMGAVQRFCDRALLLEHGRRVELGDPEHVGARYLQLNFSQDARQAEARDAGLEDGVDAPPAPEADAPAAPVRLGDGRAEILEAWFENDEGERTEVVPSAGAVLLPRPRARRGAPRGPARRAHAAQLGRRPRVGRQQPAPRRVGDLRGGRGARLPRPLRELPRPRPLLGDARPSRATAAASSGTTSASAWRRSWSRPPTRPRALVDLPFDLTVERAPAAAPEPAQ